MCIINNFLYFSNSIKLYHWMSSSHSRHVASDTLYADLQSGMDKFVEMYIGIYGRKDVLKNHIKSSLDLKVYDDKTILTLLHDFSKFLSIEISKIVKDTDLLNVRDEILGNVNQAKYRFTLS